ncbi:hypothetical protein [Nocardia sp. NPDC050710]|uniref:hypothetical protein n=1 Tax=Nocardia sp. NPDC050710 TaxID=3157220 RepID=UPI0033C43867
MSEDVERFNRQARAIDRRARTAKQPKPRYTDSQPFRNCQVTGSGQASFPATARNEWGLKDGGTVHSAHIQDYVITVRGGAWSEILLSWQIDVLLAQDLQREINRRRDYG